MKFWKMHGLGNDFIVIDERDEKISSKEAAVLAKQLCERRFSVGADGILLLSNSRVADLRMRVFNADGSEAEMCGNGIRCFAKYCYEKNIVMKQELTVETLAGMQRVWMTIDNQAVKSVRVDMGVPALDRSEIPMEGTGKCVNEELTVEGAKYKVTCVSMGNPHCVVFVDNVNNFPVQTVGPKIECSRFFPKRTNVEFAEVLNKHEVKVRVWERGCGETLACGTGACAAVVAGNLLKKLDKEVTVHLLGGVLQVKFFDHAFMTGPAEKVYEGKLF